MALQKSIEQLSGITPQYWRITRINQSVGGSAEVYLSGYLSREKRDAQPEAGVVDNRRFDIAIPKETLISGNVLEYLYAKIQAIEGGEFADATMV